MAKTKKTENFKEMKQGELDKKLVLLREEIRVIKFKTEGSRSKNVKELGNLKKQVARVLTEIKKKK
jgi:ribosomal protein L29